MTGTHQKLRGLFLAVLMVCSVFAGTVALGGTAAAAGNGNSSGFTSPLPDGTITDNTTQTNTAPGRTVEIGDVSFGTTGEVETVRVNATGGPDSAGSLPASAIDSITVELYNSSGLAASQTVDYDAHNTTVDFGSVLDVEQIRVTADVSSVASDGGVIDANLYVFANPTGFIQTANNQTIVDSDTFVRAAVSSTQDGTFENATVQFLNNDTGTVVAEATTDQDGLTPSVQVGPNANYTAVVNETGFFEASSNTRLVARGDTEELDVTLTPKGVPRDIEVIAAEPTGEQVPADGSSEIAYYVQVTGLFGENTDVPLNNIDVDSAVVTGTSITLTPATNTTEEVTLPNGTTVNGTTVFTVSSTEVQQANVSFTVASNTSLQAFAQPQFGVLAGEGTIQGQVVAEDTTSGLEDARVHAVDFDRFVRNERFALADVGAGDTDYYRVVNSTTGEVVDVDNYRVVITDASDQAVGTVEFLNESDRGVGSGFFVKDQDGTDTDNSTGVYVVPLEPGDYSLQVSETAPEASRQASPASQGPESFTTQTNYFPATQNLTYENAEELSNPYDDGGPVLTDITDEDGDYVLSKLFTDFQRGEQYVVIAQKTGYSTDFVDVNVTESGADYIIYPTTNNENFEAGGADENLNLKPRQVTPVVNVTNVGFATSVDNGQLVNFEEFDNQTDAFPQAILRDGSYTDVINVTTTGEETDTPVNATVTIELEDDLESFNGDDDSLSANATNFAGEYVAVAGGQRVSTDPVNDTVTITTGPDGQAQVWLQADRTTAPLAFQNPFLLPASAQDDYPVNSFDEEIGPPFIIATAERNPSEPDITLKRVIGRTQTASITGLVDDAENDPIGNAEVYTQSINLAFYFGDQRIELTPVDPPNPTNYTITFYNATNASIASETVPRSELADANGYAFEDFSTSLRIQFGVFTNVSEGYTLVTKSSVDDGSYALPILPAQPDDPRRSAFQENLFTVEGISPVEDNRGSSQGFPVPGGTDDANILIRDITPATFEVTDLQPDGATVTAGTTINPTANVTNVGAEEGSVTAEFGLDVNENGQLDDNEVLDTVTTELLTSGETEQVTFTVDTTDVAAGTYTHIVAAGDGSDTASITIEESQQGVVAQYDANDDGAINNSELLDALADYPDQVSDQDLLQLLSVYDADA